MNDMHKCSMCKEIRLATKIRGNMIYLYILLASYNHMLKQNDQNNTHNESISQDWAQD